MKSKSKNQSMNRYRDARKSEMILLGLAMLVVFAASVRYLGENYSLKVWGDEFGYWQSAAYLTGKDWSSIASTNSYYGFGFGILLAPIMLLFGHDSMMMLHAALVLEALLLSSCVAAAYLLIGYFNNQVKGITRILIAVVSVVYPSNILSVNLTMAEILVVTLIWWYTYAVLRFIKEKKLGLAIVIMILSVYMYSVHQRTIAVMAISLALICWVYREKIFTPKLLAVAAVLGGGLLLVFMFKNAYVSSMYAQTSQTHYEANNLAGQSSKIVNILTSMDGFRKFLQSVIGKFYYISVASFMLAVLGIVKCMQTSLRCIREKKDWDRMAGVLVIAANYIAAHMIGAIYMSDGFGYRTDILIYGRYIEHSIGPLIVLGILYLYESESAKTVLATMSLTALAAWLSAGTIEYRASNSNMWSNCSAIADLFEDSRYLNSEELYMALFRSCIFLFVLYFSLALRKHFKNWAFHAVLVCICFTWISIGYQVRNEHVIPWADELYRKQIEVLSYVDENEFGIYHSYVGGFFQFLRVDASVKNYESMEDILEAPGAPYIITYAQAEDIDYIRENQEVIFENDIYTLWRASED